MRPQIVKNILIFAHLFVSCFVFAQQKPPPPQPERTPAPYLPLDEYLLILLLAGVALGVYLMLKSKKVYSK